MDSSPTMSPTVLATSGTNDLSLNHIENDAQSTQSTDPVPNPSPTNTHQMITRSKAAIFKPKVYTTSVNSFEPTTIQEVMLIPSWKDNVHEELQALIRNRTWDLVSPPSDHHLVGNKWLFKTQKILIGLLLEKRLDLSPKDSLRLREWIIKKPLARLSRLT